MGQISRGAGEPPFVRPDKPDRNLNATDKAMTFRNVIQKFSEIASKFVELNSSLDSKGSNLLAFDLLQEIIKCKARILTMPGKELESYGLVVESRHRHGYPDTIRDETETLERAAFLMAVAKELSKEIILKQS